MVKRPGMELVEVGYRHNVLKTRTQDEITRKREEGPEVSMYTASLQQEAESIKYAVGSQTSTALALHLHPGFSARLVHIYEDGRQRGTSVIVPMW